MKIFQYLLGAALLFGLSIGLAAQSAFEDKKLQTIQSEIASATQWHAEPVTPIRGSNPNMVITQWTSKAERGVVIITLYLLDSEQAAGAKLESFTESFHGKTMGGLGEAAKSLGKPGDVAFRRGPVVATVRAVAMTTNRRNSDQERETLLRTRFAKAADEALSLVYPSKR